MPQTEEARSKPLVGNPRALEVGLFWGAAESLSRREWVEQGRMCGLFSAEQESQSGSERVEARSAQTPEFRLFESACFPDYPSSDLPQTRLAKVMHRMHHHAKQS